MSRAWWSPFVLSLVLALSLALSGAARAESPAPCPSADELTSGEERPARVLDLNRADEQALLALPGIGPARARAIVSFRAQHGSFRSVSQLLQIRGIGRALLRQLRPLLTLSEPPP